MVLEPLQNSVEITPTNSPRIPLAVSLEVCFHELFFNFSRSSSALGNFRHIGAGMTPDSSAILIGNYSGSSWKFSRGFFFKEWHVPSNSSGSPSDFMTLIPPSTFSWISSKFFLWFLLPMLLVLFQKILNKLLQRIKKKMYQKFLKKYTRNSLGNFSSKIISQGFPTENVSEISEKKIFLDFFSEIALEIHLGISSRISSKVFLSVVRRFLQILNHRISPFSQM